MTDMRIDRAEEGHRHQFGLALERWSSGSNLGQTYTIHAQKPLSVSRKHIPD